MAQATDSDSLVPYFAYDHHSDDNDLVLVLETATGHTAGEYEIDALDGQTVAEVNYCGDDEPVIFAVYADKVSKRLDAWVASDVQAMYDNDDLEAAGVRVYAFPVSRLVDAEQFADCEGM